MRKLPRCITDTRITVTAFEEIKVILNLTPVPAWSSCPLKVLEDSSQRNLHQGKPPNTRTTLQVYHGLEHTYDLFSYEIESLLEGRILTKRPEKKLNLD